MKIRVRFSKQGPMKFVGHLDMVRYFQKVLRRAEVDVVYSEGFSPHQKMSFAAPLSVGVTSRGEYFDLEVAHMDSSAEMICRMNENNVEGVEVLSCRLLPEDAKNAMSIVAGADYIAYTDLFDEEMLQSFMAKDKVTVLKKTKKSEKEVDILPMIYNLQPCPEGVFMRLAQGSASNLKPELVLKTLADNNGICLPAFVQYERLDMYCTENEKLLSLGETGVEVLEGGR